MSSATMAHLLQLGRPDAAPRLPVTAKAATFTPPLFHVPRQDPRPGARWVLPAKRADGPGLGSIDLDVDFGSDGERVPAPYEELLSAAMRGDQSHFTREDSVEETWRVIDPLLDLPERPLPYAAGSWGPAAAEHLTTELGGWHPPWLPPGHPAS
ncbi:MAG: hypothetical protein HHJ13_07145 [Phycicoccus sp.]|nr:hypothetical protein [Phycicoccus sp.]